MSLKGLVGKLGRMVWFLEFCRMKVTIDIFTVKLYIIGGIQQPYRWTH